MDLEAAVLEALRFDRSRALTFSDVVKDVAERLEPSIRETLNRLHDSDQIKRHPSGRNHLWRYQALPFERRV